MIFMVDHFQISIPAACATRKHTDKTFRPRSHTIGPTLNGLSDPKAFESTSISNDRPRKCECFDLYKDLVPYGKAWSWQRRIVRDKMTLIERKQDCPDTLIILQHHPVYTLGTGSSEEYLNFDIKNAPCQLVMYPIINLRNHRMDLHWYLRALEEVGIRVLSTTFSIKASRLKGFTGVWVGSIPLSYWFWGPLVNGDKKVAAIGIRASQWITHHGLALNVTTDLTPFQSIVPCGIRNRQVGTIKGLLGELQQSTGYLKADVPHPNDCQLIDITHASLIKEFSGFFQLEIHHKTIHMLEFEEATDISSLRRN